MGKVATVDQKLARQLYVIAVQDASWTPATVCRRLGWGSDEYVAAVQVLSELGLLVRTTATPSGWACMSSESALGHLLAADASRVDALIEQSTRTRDALVRMLTDFAPIHAQRVSGTQAVLVEGTANIAAALEDAAQQARDEVLTLRPGRGVPQHLLEDGLARDLRVLRRGVAMRAVYLTSSAATPEIGPHVRELRRAGGQVRTAVTLPHWMIVIDRHLAVVPATGTEGQSAAVVVYDPSLVEVFRVQFEHAWTEAAGFGRSDGPGDESDGLTDRRHRAVLRLLAEGLTDEAVGRRLGVSDRTVRRMVGELTTRLGATSRFQVAVLAERADWLSPGTGDIEQYVREDSGEQAPEG
ncbi:erythropoiesis-stimulating protein [Streptomyces antnestii]|uniref:Erythropoiesis-stimulating protein n=1 Tax=Streptomyces antnestii TaxID=2494256 RepID=A0A437Q0C0_9ACTN|nr:erythropoiesis-stimulating protein [Streptomyces sp. San01]